MTVALPRNMSELRAAITADPSATLLGGGTDLMVEVNLHGRRPGSIIGLRRVDELSRWSSDGRTVRIGAGVPWGEMEVGEIARLVPALAEAARTVGSPQIRAAGTLGGNLGTCSPAGDGLPVLAALDASIEIDGPTGRRTTPLNGFMTGPKRNDLLPGELIVAVDFPVVDGWQGYAKVGTRNAMVIATASCCLVRDAGRGTWAVALGAVGPTILRCAEAEAFLAAEIPAARPTTPSDAVAREFARLVSSASRPIDDHRSTADYRRHAVGVLARRLLERSCR